MLDLAEKYSQIEYSQIKYSQIIANGIKKKYIALEEYDEQKGIYKYIRYCATSKRYKFTDPEELVRAETFVQLIESYKYPTNRILFEVTVPRRTPNDWADIVVYKDDECEEPYIVVECKQRDVSNAEFLQAIEQGFGNANSLRCPFLWVTSGVQNKCYDVKSYKPQEREANIIAAVPIDYQGIAKGKYAKGGFYYNPKTKKEEEAFELETVTESELTKIFKQAHDALWAGGKRNPQEAFDELDKLIFCKLIDEKDENLENGQYYKFQKFTGESNTALLKRICEIYDAGKIEDPEVFKEGIRLSAGEVATVVGFFQKLNLGSTDLDSKGKAFETFLGSYFRGEFGQYFTPRNIVEFIVESLPITNKNYVMDTSCGSGGFLLYTLNKIRNIAKEKLANNKINKDAYYKFWHDFAEKRLFGIEISEGIARSAKMNMKIHDDGHTNVVSHDGLSPIEKIAEDTHNDKIKPAMFDYILTNPPFGATIKRSESPYIKKYELGHRVPNWIDRKIKGISLDSVFDIANKKYEKDNESTEVLFLEQAHNFLKDDGILAIVLPDGLLTNSSMQDLRDWLLEKYRLIASVSMPEFAFAAKDANVKSSVLFLQKYSAEKTQQIRMIKDSIQDFIYEKYKKKIFDIEKNKKNAIKLLKNITNEAEFKESRATINNEFKEEMEALREDMQDEYLDKLKTKLDDYPIFMAVAEQIGYDATGKETKTNELIDIAKELNTFIKTTIKGGQDFF